MIFYALIKPNGCIESAGISRNPPAGYVHLPEGCTPDDELRLMYVDGAWQPRPSLMLAQTATGVSIPDCPDGVRMDVYDAGSGAFLGSSDDGSADLPDAGRYRIEVLAPEPWAPLPPLIVTVL